jgi:hypothetical protein
VRNDTFCQSGEILNGGNCALQVRFLDDCSGLRRVMEQQAQRMQAAESARQGACSTSIAPDCSTLSGTSQSEASLYRSLQERYRQCLQRSRIAYPFTGFGYISYSSGLLFSPLDFELEYQ